ncbi:hypothetical protein GF386_04890 [Candidatus Pacearchaeota archaeon]|nr:hypothetical protein [Candidatus Pacearchaeota archaeon]MBD3283449.1 hypothetical protein [Candidatus Pacearchaeota archaeon]
MDTHTDTDAVVRSPLELVLMNIWNSFNSCPDSGTEDYVVYMRVGAKLHDLGELSYFGDRNFRVAREIPEITPEKRLELYREHGFPRTAGNLSTEDMDEFVRWVSSAFYDAQLVHEEYGDSMRFDFPGILIEAKSELVSSGSGFSEYRFSAGFDEQLLQGHDIYRTEWSYKYPKPHDDRDDDVDDNLGMLREALENKLGPVEITGSRLWIPGTENTERVKPR